MAIRGDRSAEGHSDDAAEVNIEDDEAHEIYQQMIERAYEETVQNLFIRLRTYFCDFLVNR